MFLSTKTGKALHSTPDYLMGWVDDPEDYDEEDQAADFHKEAEADRRLLNAYHAADPKTQNE